MEVHSFVVGSVAVLAASFYGPLLQPQSSLIYRQMNMQLEARVKANALQSGNCLCPCAVDLLEQLV